MIRTLFVYTNISIRGANFGPYPSMQYGMASISALLKRHGHMCDLILLRRRSEMNEVENRIKCFLPDILAFTSVSTQFPYVVDVSKNIRATFKNLFQICGGPHATVAPEQALELAEFDAICVGEGEYPMLELVQALSDGRDYLSIPNLYFKHSKYGIIKNRTRSFMADIDKLPFFDRDLFAEYVNLDKYPHSVMTTRGCPFDCNYCCNQVFRTVANGQYVRSRSIDNIIVEIRELKKRYSGLKYLYIEDEAVGLNKRLWRELLPRLEQEGLEYGANYRIGVAPLDFLDKLKEANFVKLNIGIESGNEKIRRTVLGRNYTNKQIQDTFSRAKELGIATKSYNLIGLPYETPECFEDTIAINRAVFPDQTILNIFYPYPGTSLNKTCEELYLKKKSILELVKERTESILDLPGFPHEKLMWYFDNWDDLIDVKPFKCFRKHAREVKAYAGRFARALGLR